ncbi:MAG TPA: elongation factor G [Gaiellaceae bacterium]|jgi:elongation factor G|nr:elongation factor G [Gaiellaceae bacterium]
MAATEPGKIRNIAVAGHRGVGKTSLAEALLFQAGKTNRLGSVEQGTTVSDWDEHEQRRRMSLSGSLCHLEWKERKINVVDTPGDTGFQADTFAALRVVEGVVAVLSGVMGVEVNTTRVWQRAEEQELSRVVFVNMLDRERADFYRVLEAVRQQLSDRCVAIQLPIGSEHELTGVVDLLHMCAYVDPGGGREGGPQPIPDSMADVVAEHREKLLDAVVETDEELMARYLEGEELDAEAVALALKQAVTRDELYPVACGVASKNLGTTALLDLLVEGVPSPARKGTTIEFGDAKQAVFVFKTIADPFTGRISCFRVLAGPVSGDTTLVDPRTHAKERLGQVLLLQGKDSEPVDELCIGDLGAVAKLKDVVTGDVLVDHEVPVEPPHIDFPQPVMSFAITPQAKGDEEKMATGLRRLSEEDPTLLLRRDPQTGEQLLSGLSQMQVEVAVDRLRTRFNVEVELHPPRVPYKETIRREARARHRYKKQTGGRGQFGDCEIVIEPIGDGGDGGETYEFVDKIVGGVISQGYRPAVDKGVREAMEHGELAGAPVYGIRVTLVDGMEHSVDSSEMAFKIAGSMAFKEAYQKAEPVLLEPIMQVEVSVPDDAVGAVNGDLNSRRGRLHGMEPAGGMTTIMAEVPMAEILTYSQALTSMTGGRGDYSMHFLRYEEVPSHVAQKIIEQTKREREEAKV